MKDIRDALSSTNATLRALAFDRKRALETWLDQEHPLASSNTSLPFLLRALYPRDTGEPTLTYSYLGKQTTAWFADLIVKQCTNTTTRRAPPFIKEGTARAVLVVSLHEAMKSATRAAVPTQDIPKYLSQCVILVCNHLKISFIPWSANTLPGQRQSSTVVHNVWITLSAPTMESTRNRIILASSGDAGIIRTSQSMIQDDPRGEWKALEVRLQDFASILHKSTPPTEFDVAHAALPASSHEVIDIYNYVFTIYDGTTPLHQLALFCAFIFAGLAPNVYAPPKTHEKPPSGSAPLKAYIRKLKWCEREGKKGCSNRVPYIVMATVFFIAYLDNNSPIHTLLINQPKSLTSWHSKHSALFLVFLFRAKTNILHELVQVRRVSMLSPCAVLVLHVLSMVASWVLPVGYKT